MGSETVWSFGSVLITPLNSWETDTWQSGRVGFGPPSPWAYGSLAGWPWVATSDLGQPEPKPRTLFLQYKTEQIRHFYGLTIWSGHKTCHIGIYKVFIFLWPNVHLIAMGIVPPVAMDWRVVFYWAVLVVCEIGGFSTSGEVNQYYVNQYDIMLYWLT